MSSSGPTKEWLVHVPDHPNVLDKRLESRPKHLTNVQPEVESGRVIWGGALLSKHPEEGQTPDMVGSAFLMKANSEEEIREWMKNDPYTRGGAWDYENAKIWPFRLAVMTNKWESPAKKSSN